LRSMEAVNKVDTASNPNLPTIYLQEVQTAAGTHKAAALFYTPGGVPAYREYTAPTSPLPGIVPPNLYIDHNLGSQPMYTTGDHDGKPDQCETLTAPRYGFGRPVEQTQLHPVSKPGG
jgi:hypothetical protein